MQDQMRRLLDSLMGPVSDACWHPAVDVYQGREGWLVKFDLAGVRPGDIRVVTHGRLLTVSGIRRDWSILEGQQAYSMEIAYNRFERSIELPCDLDHYQVKYDYRDGMLLVSIVSRESPT